MKKLDLKKVLQNNVVVKVVSETETKKLFKILNSLGLTWADGCRYDTTTLYTDIKVKYIDIRYGQIVDVSAFEVEIYNLEDVLISSVLDTHTLLKFTEQSRSIDITEIY